MTFQWESWLKFCRQSTWGRFREWYRRQPKRQPLNMTNLPIFMEIRSFNLWYERVAMFLNSYPPEELIFKLCSPLGSRPFGFVQKLDETAVHSRTQAAWLETGRVRNIRFRGRNDAHQERERLILEKGNCWLKPTGIITAPLIRQHKSKRYARTLVWRCWTILSSYFTSPRLHYF